MSLIRWLSVQVARLPLVSIACAVWPLLGMFLVGYGAYRIYPPAGCIAFGLLIILDTLHSSRSRGE